MTPLYLLVITAYWTASTLQATELAKQPSINHIKTAQQGLEAYCNLLTEYVSKPECSPELYTNLVTWLTPATMYAIAQKPGCTSVSPKTLASLQHLQNLALLHASGSGHRSFTKRLLSSGVNPNICTYESKSTPLMFAVSKKSPGRLANVQLLIAHKADLTAVNKAGKTAYDIALGNGLADETLLNLLKPASKS